MYEFLEKGKKRPLEEEESASEEKRKLEAEEDRKLDFFSMSFSAANSWIPTSLLSRPFHQKYLVISSLEL